MIGIHVKTCPHCQTTFVAFTTNSFTRKWFKHYLRGDDGLSDCAVTREMFIKETYWRGML